MACETIGSCNCFSLKHLSSNAVFLRSFGNLPLLADVEVLEARHIIQTQRVTRTWQKLCLRYIYDFKLTLLYVFLFWFFALIRYI